MAALPAAMPRTGGWRSSDRRGDVCSPHGPLSLLVLLALARLLVSCRGGPAKTAPATGGAAIPSPPFVSAGSAGCGRAHAAALNLESITSGGVKRTYRLYVPRGYDPASSAVLVVPRPHPGSWFSGIMAP